MRETIAFLRDPATFTAGPGLGKGDLYRLRVPAGRLHVVTDPEAAERILVAQADHFEKSRVYWRALARSMGESIGTLETAHGEHLRERQRPYFTPEAAHGHLPAVAEQVRLQFERAAGREGEAAVVLQDLFAELHARVVLATLFGQEDAPAAPDVARRVVDGHAIVAWRDAFPWRPLLGWWNGANRRAARHRRWLHAYVDGLRHVEASTDPRRLLHALLRLEAEAEPAGGTGSILRNEAVFHLGAGIETSAAATAWTIHLLSSHPAALERVRAEGARLTAGAGPGRSPAGPLAYTGQVVQEALRLFPPVYAILRDCVRPTEVGGQAFRAGDVFIVSICGLHRNPRLWQDPGSFRPERFAPEAARAIGRYHYLPFGAGRRACIGRHLALSAVAVTVALFARRFDWEILDPAVRAVPSPSLKPSGGLRARLRPRSEPRP